MFESVMKEAIKVIPTNWPLPGFIATNPLWDLHEQPFQETLESLKFIMNIQGVMPIAYYQDLFTNNVITESNLISAITEYLKDKNCSSKEVSRLKNKLIHPPSTSTISNLDKSSSSFLKPRLVTEHLSVWLKKSLPTEIQKAICQFLMSYFCNPTKSDSQPAYDSIFNSWRLKIAQHDRKLHSIVNNMQSNNLLTVSEILNEFKISTQQQCSYLKRIFYYMLGWSSLIKWLEQRPENPYLKKPAQLIDILLIWLCYEKYYFTRYSKKYNLMNLNESVCETNDNELSYSSRDFKYRFIWQRAFELAYQNSLMNKLMQVKKDDLIATQNKPIFQAIFCIDTRSEGIRRHLEKNKGYQTFGFAGFFGFVFHFEKSKDCHTLQCPALFPPEIYLKNEQSETYVTQQSQNLLSSFQEVKKSLFAPMGFVELTGVLFGIVMLIKAYSTKLFKAIKQQFDYDSQENNLKQIISPLQTNTTFPLETKVNNAKQFLSTIGLTHDFAPLILICGHGGETENNPYQASFDCGACGGNAGYSNAIVTAHILNDTEVRVKLKYQGISIPKDTHFIAGFHNTTQDKITLYEKGISEHLKSKLIQLKQDLKLACDNLRHEREQDLPSKSSPIYRTSDWAELIPEMGLINNAALIVGPRRLTKGVSLERRTFLHSYEPANDPDGQLLANILLGPLIVAHWINAQYFFSTTDPNLYGSGNKMLHNVLPKIGVIEGNFSDLKLGLPWQSIGFQNKILHQPLRLLVIIYARKQLVDNLLQQLPTINALFINKWAHLKVIEPGE